MEDSIRFKKNPDIITRTIEDETILMPLYKTSAEIDCIYTLNSVAARIWELIDGKRSLGKIKNTLLEEFDVPETKVEKDLSRLLKDLAEIKAIIR
jgi:hypothetical protein